jgi:hypothetical protein
VPSLWTPSQWRWHVLQYVISGLSFNDKIFFPMLMIELEVKLSIASLIDYEYCFIVVASRIIFKIYVPIAASSTWLFSFFHNILVFVLLSMLFDISSCTCAHSLGIVAQIKLTGNLRWYVKFMVWYFFFVCL